MKTFKLKVLAGALLGASIGVPSTASAAGYPVFDAVVAAAVESVAGAVAAMSASVSTLLYNIGSAINQNGQKVSSTIEAAAQTQRDFNVLQESNRRMEDARQRYDVPTSICAESGSGGATQIAGFAGSARAAIRPGGGAAISNQSVAQAVNTPAVTQSVDASRAAKIHAQYCDTDDFAAYGGARSCPVVSSSMPGADKRIDSILVGAGTDGKAPELTFSQQQTDAARMYVQNSVRRSVGPQLRKAEADTLAGAQYIGLMNQYNAILSAAANPQEQHIADSLPNPVTKALLKETLMSASANTYYQLVASSTAKSSGMMSSREFEQFEVGRRYSNTAYQTDLQAMSGDNLLRELIRVAALQSWMMLELKNEVQKGNIINGMTLSSNARQEFEPILSQKYRSVPGRPGG